MGKKYPGPDANISKLLDLQDKVGKEEADDLKKFVGIAQAENVDDVRKAIQSKIPPGAVLLIDVSLLSSQSQQDILDAVRLIEFGPKLTLVSNEEACTSITEIMRDADALFSTTGGGTRHYVRDLLLPMLERAGLRICKIEDK